MKKLMLMLAAGLIVTGCHKDAPVAGDDTDNSLCSDEKAIAASASSGIAQALGCKDQGAIANSLMGVLGKANTCVKAEAARETLRKKYAAGEKADAAKDKGILGNILCPPAASMLTSYMAGKLPSAWKCDGGKTAEMAAATFTRFCVSAIPL